MNISAIELNERIQAISPEVFAMLSELGKRMYFPAKGILSQSAEAKQFANKYNASIGVALESGQAMHLDSVMDNISDFNANDALLYAPSYGNKELRDAWWQKNLYDNPDLKDLPCSLPIVTNGLSGALSVAADLFLNPQDHVLLPNMNWDNYLLNFEDRCAAEIKYYNYFKDDGLDLQAFENILANYKKDDKIFVVLNFPNNPSGYTATEVEADFLAQKLIEAAERGVYVVTLIDDAYYGLFYSKEAMKQSIFTKLAAKHERLMAIKADAATKEVYVWGLRVGFISFSVGGVEENSPLYKVLEEKAAGIIRSTISNCSILSQKIAWKALQDPNFYTQRDEKAALMEKRVNKVRETLADNPQFKDEFEAYPFNSGYFMCIKLKKANSEILRKHLLKNYGIGCIAISDTNLRIAFSCLEESEIKDLFEQIYKACKDLG